MTEVKRGDLIITHVRGSGPGGQNRNKRMSGVRIEHLPSGLVVTATERRSQAQNLSNAWERLKEKLRVLNYRPPERIPTRPTRASKEWRLKGKQWASQKKIGRKKADWTSE